MSELKTLLNYLLKSDNLLAKKAALIVSKYSNDALALRAADTILDDGININISELESLVNPDKFKFPNPDIGRIGVEDE